MSTDVSSRSLSADRVIGRKAARAMAGVGTGLIAAASLISLAPAASAATPGCSDVEVVFARGTAEPVGVGRVGQAFVDSLKGDLRGKSVSVYAVDYPASYDFLKATDGAMDAGAHVQATVANCPSTSIVLGGFSQGAAVVDSITAPPGALFGLARPMSDDVANHVAAVVVFGNPSNKIGQPLTALSPLYAAKAADLCNGADPVCSPGDDRAAHSLYVESGLTAQAASFVAGRVSSEAA